LVHESNHAGKLGGNDRPKPSLIEDAVALFLMEAET